MNAHSLRSVLSRRHAAHFTILFLLFLIAACGFTAGTMQSSAEASVGDGRGSQRPPEFANTTAEDIKKDFSDDDLKVKEQKPRGKWGYGLGVDKDQFDDASVPVAVGAVQSLSGGGKYVGVVKVKRLEIKNRSGKAINSVQLRWKITNFDNPAKVLLEGTTPFVNFWAEANSSQVIQIPTIYPSLLFKPLARDGELDGEFMLTIGVQEARFADGSFWRRQEPVVWLDVLYHDQTVANRFPRLASLSPIFPSLWVDPGGSRVIIRPCEAKPRSSASAFSSMPFQETTCQDDMSTKIDEYTGQQSCGTPSPGDACYSNCNDGWCNVYVVPGDRCSPTATPTLTPTPTPTPTPVPETCSCNSGLKPNPSCTGCFTHNGVSNWFCDTCQFGPQVDFCRYAGDGCPDGYYNDGSPCCQPWVVEGYGGSNTWGWCDIELPATCTDAADNDGDRLIDDGDPGCWCPSPILIDTAGDGFDLTDAPGGVEFDINHDGLKERLSWTAAGSDDAWLALDRDGNGLIDDGTELFGNYTAQPASPRPNGFAALAEFDAPAAGGHPDGVMDARDAVFDSLRLWRDANHDGASQPGELHALAPLGVASISLDYKEVRRRDRHGNGFRYQAEVRGTERRLTRRLAFDVFLIPGR